MLNEDDRLRIREEELFREEVRKQLAPADSPSSRYWDLLNKPFTLWLLGSIVLASATAGFAYLQASFAKEAARRLLIEKSDLEIDARFSQFLESMDDIVATPRQDGLLFKRDITQATLEAHIQELKMPPARNSHGWVTGVYPEFQTMGLPALILQLAAQVPETSEKERLEKIGKRMSQLHALPIDMKGFLATWNALRDEVLLPRWRSMWYTDCLSSAFC